MTAITAKANWEKAMREKGHTPRMDGDMLDIFVTDHGYHNGPGCTSCGWTTCWHCNQDVEDIPDCPKRREKENVV